MLLHLARVLSGLGVALAGALWFSTGHPAHAVCGGTLFAMGTFGIGWQGWEAVKRLRGGEVEKETGRRVSYAKPSMGLQPDYNRGQGFRGTTRVVEMQETLGFPRVS
jgi:hypothetical protein